MSVLPTVDQIRYLSQGRKSDAEFLDALRVFLGLRTYSQCERDAQTLARGYRPRQAPLSPEQRPPVWRGGVLMK